MAQTSVTLDGKPCIDPRRAAEECARLGLDDSDWRDRANSFTRRRGRHPSTGTVLLAKQELDQLSGAGAADFFSYNHTLQFDGGQGSWFVGFGGLLITEVQACCGGALQLDGSTICRLELADVRVTGSFTSINRHFNVKGPSGDILPYSDQEVSDPPQTPHTWATMFAALWGLLPTTFGAAPTLPSTPAAAPENYSFVGMSAWDAINDVLDDLGLFVALDPAGTDAFVFLPYGANTTFDADHVVADRHAVELSNPRDALDRRWLPATVRVFFPRRDYANVPTRMAHSVDAAVTDDHALPNTTMAVWDSLAAVFDESGTNVNSAALTTRAGEVRDRIQNEAISSAPTDDVYSGVLEPSKYLYPNARLSECSVYDLGDGTFTRLRREWLPPSPRNQRPRLLSGQDGEVAFGVTDGSAAAGATCVVSVYRWNGSTHTDTGRNVTARNGTLSSIAAGARVLLVRDPSSTNQWIIPPDQTAASAATTREVWRGKLDAKYSQATGGTVALSVYDLNDVDTGDNITLTPRDHWGYAYANEWVIAIEDMVIGKITGATNAAPIVITSNTHGLSNGNVVVVSGVGGNTAANGTWVVGAVAANTFELVGSSGNGAYTSGGKWSLQSGTKIYRPIHPDGQTAHGTVDGSALIAPGSTATVSIHRWVGSTFTDTGDNETARNACGMPIFPGLRVRLHWDRVDKQWLMYQETKRLIFGKFGSAVSAGSSGTITFHYGNSGSTTSWAITATAYCTMAVAANKLCVADWDQKDQDWYAFQIEC